MTTSKNRVFISMTTGFSDVSMLIVPAEPISLIYNNITYLETDHDRINLTKKDVKKLIHQLKRVLQIEKEIELTKLIST